MKRQFIWLMAAILIGAFTMTACDDSDDEVTKEEEKANDNVAAKAEVTYYVDLGANTLELADVEVTYLDENKQEKTIHPGAVTVTDGHHPVMKGSQMAGWWLTYALGINPDKLLNFDKKTLTVKSDLAEFNDMDYRYPYIQ